MWSLRRLAITTLLQKENRKRKEEESNTDATKSNTNDAKSNTKSNTKRKRKSNTKNNTISNTKLEANQQRVLDFCRETAHTAKEIFRHLKISVQVKRYEVYVRQLETAGKLKDVTPDKKRDKRYKAV